LPIELTYGDAVKTDRRQAGGVYFVDNFGTKICENWQKLWPTAVEICELFFKRL